MFGYNKYSQTIQTDAMI